MASVDFTYLPIIDFAKANTDRDEQAKKIVQVLESVGFAFIDNVQGIDFKGSWDRCQWLFAKPIDFKRKIMRKHWNSDNSNIYRGYFPVVPDQPSRQEAFEFARDVQDDDPTISRTNWFYEKSAWPDEDEALPFKEFMQGQYEVIHETCLELLRLCAIGLGIPKESFTDLFNPNPCSTFSLLHCPTWEGQPPEYARLEDNKVVATPEHTDSDFMTLLTPFHYGGLEIMQANGKWAAVKTRPFSLVMNIGDTFSRILGGRFKATLHRVLDIGQDRYSVPFFLSPKFHGDIGINFLSQYTQEGDSYFPERFRPWLLNTMKYKKKYFEHQDLPQIEN